MTLKIVLRDTKSLYALREFPKARRRRKIIGHNIGSLAFDWSFICYSAPNQFQVGLWLEPKKKSSQPQVAR